MLLCVALLCVVVCCCGVLLVVVGCCWLLCVVVCCGGCGGCGGCGTGVVQRTRVCPCVRTMHLIKWAGANAPTPSAGLTSRQKPYALSLRRQVPGVPECKQPHPTPSRGKRLRGTPASPSTPSEEGGRNLFHRLEVECPWSGMLTGSTLTRVFLVRRTLLTMLPPSPTE